MLLTTGLRNEFEVHDERFLYLTLPNCWVERLYNRCLWAEGPVYFADGDYLLWSDIPNNRMLRFAGEQVSVFRTPSNNSNGNHPRSARSPDHVRTRRPAGDAD